MSLIIHTRRNEKTLNKATQKWTSWINLISILCNISR